MSGGCADFGACRHPDSGSCEGSQGETLFEMPYCSDAYDGNDTVNLSIAFFLPLVFHVLPFRFPGRDLRLPSNCSSS